MHKVWSCIAFWSNEVIAVRKIGYLWLLYSRFLSLWLLIICPKLFRKKVLALLNLVFECFRADFFPPPLITVLKLTVIVLLSCLTFSVLSGWFMGFQKKSKEEKHWGSVRYCNWVSHVSSFAGMFLMQNHRHHCSHVLQSRECSGNWHWLIFHFPSLMLLAWHAGRQHNSLLPSTEHHKLRRSTPAFPWGPDLIAILYQGWKDLWVLCWWQLLARMQRLGTQVSPPQKKREGGRPRCNTNHQCYLF